MKYYKDLKQLTIFLLTISLLLLSKNVYADDYSDDIYDGDYSLIEMLKNYNVITFGKKEIDSRMTQSNFSKGDEYIFHINGQFLVNGTIRNKNSSSRIDLKGSNNNFSSFYKNKESNSYFCGYLESPTSGTPTYDMYFNGCNSDNYNIYSDDGTPFYFRTYYNSKVKPSIVGNYMNFDRLYDSIIEEQQNITKGKKLDESKDTLHINIGGEYYIDDISNIKDIIFDNFENNRNELTVITVNNSEVDEFPQLFRSNASSNYNTIPTNDYIGMTRPNYSYARYYVIDTYYGNIIWNFPNANYIRFNSGVPIVGHIVAPKADIESTKDFHIAGTILANSVYFKGLSEAHFYPLVIEDIPYGNDPEPIDEPSANEQVVTNPNTNNNLIVILLITILSFIFVLKNVNKKKID
ncbi:MAG: choice-of-anchor A family protein [Bacilli bacterium]|nr:choice-of-anchor A family protein [Bacilli bacterium]